MGDIAAEKMAERAKRNRSRISQARDNRRFKSGVVANGIVGKLASGKASGTIFPSTVVDWSPDCGETILKSGRHNQKIGGAVISGGLKGARIFTLSLEERATCPRACVHWRSCYGNSMPLARRWRPSYDWLCALKAEVFELCRKHEKVLIRLHVLGDFYSIDYLEAWAKAVMIFPNLTVFGFTSWKAGSPIGDAVDLYRGALGNRFSIRHSNMTGDWGAFTLDFPTQLKRIGDAIVCPEQLSSNGEGRPGVHCGNCGACWQTSKPIAFIQH